MADTGELLIHLEYIRKAADETNAHLARLNGRVSAVETKQAILEDRASDARNSAVKWGGAVGAGMAALVAGLWSFFAGAK